MPTDLTGTPTSLGIGTYNVDADAPSGLGFNAAMAQIDALIAARVATPGGIAAGEAMIWNGTTFVRSSVTNLTRSNISGSPLGSRQIFTASGTYNTPAGCKAILIYACGGGGAGGGASATGASQAAVGGGGSGGTTVIHYVLSPAASYAVTIAAAAAGVSGAAGNDGGDTTFGAIVTAKGGKGGGASGAITPPGYGAAFINTAAGNVGDIILPGGLGSLGIAQGFSSGCVGGGGGVGFMGATGANHTISVGSNGNSAGANTGGGGAGAANGQSAAAKTGGSGGTGIVIVWEFY